KLQEEREEAEKRLRLAEEENRRRLDDLRRRYELEERYAQDDFNRKITRMQYEFQIEEQRRHDAFSAQLQAEHNAFQERYNVMVTRLAEMNDAESRYGEARRNTATFWYDVMVDDANSWASRMAQIFG